MSTRDPQSTSRRRRRPEASYDEASRAHGLSLGQGPASSGAGATGTGITRMGFFGCAALAVIAARLVWLQVVRGEELAEAAESQRTNTVTLHAKRGTIYDRNGKVLAMSVDCQTVYANPQLVTDPSAVAALLAEHLGGSSSDYVDLLLEDTTFVYVEQRVDEDIAEALEADLDAQGLSGIYFLDDVKRVYPFGSTAAQIIGYVGTDGEMIMEAGLDGTPIAGGVYDVTEAQDGTDIVVALDVDLQAAVEPLVVEAVETYEAESGSALVMDPRTGEVLAACSTPLPDFDNLTDVSTLNLGLVTDCFEPGSIFKLVTTAIGFELGLFDVDTTYTVPVTIEVGDDTVNDHDTRDYTMTMTVREMMRRSSNVGMALLEQTVIGSEAFADGVDAFGIGQATGIDFPGEADGIIYTPDYEYYEAQAGFMAFGQGVSIPMIQIIRAYQAVANGGVGLVPHLLLQRGEEEVDWGEGVQIVSAETCAKEVDVLRTVMEEGTGTTGLVDGYDIAGKTGTGEQASSEGGYEDYSYTSSLCGFANADDPEVLVYAGLNGTSYLASSSAGELFADLMGEAVSILGVQPAETDDDEDED